MAAPVSVSAEVDRLQSTADNATLYSTYATVVTKADQIPGVIILGHSLHRSRTHHSLLVLATISLPAASLHALHLEAAYNPLFHIRTVQKLDIPGHKFSSDRVPGIVNDPEALLCADFTELRIFGLTEYKRVVYIDPSVLCLKCPDDLISLQSSPDAKLVAAPECICNLDDCSWLPSDWTPDNCRYTHQGHPESMNSVYRPVDTQSVSSPPRARNIFNSGVLVIDPSQPLYDDMRRELANFDFKEETPSFHAFLNSYVEGQWAPMSWRFNALKSLRYSHANIWTGHNAPSRSSDEAHAGSLTGDEYVSLLNFLGDKPWQSRIASDGIAGAQGRDGVTHRWWWDAYESWRKERFDSPLGSKEATQRGVTGKRAAEEEVKVLLEAVGQHIAPELDEAGDERVCEENERRGYPVPLEAKGGMNDIAREGLDRIKLLR